MTSDAAGLANPAALDEEESMATYYIMERDHGQGDGELASGLYSHNTQKGYPKAGSSQSICKWLRSSPRRLSPHL